MKSENQVSKIYIGNLPARCTEKDLENLCKQFGNVVRADIVKNFGFVIYENKEDAQTAVSNLNDYEFQDSRLQVELARSKLHVDGKDDNQCYECGKQGHWARECPKRIANGGRRGPTMRGPPDDDRDYYRGKGPPPRDRAPARSGYDDYDRGYDRNGQYDRPPPPRGYDSYERGPSVSYPSQYRPRSRSPPGRRDYPPSRDPYARDPYARDPYARDPYARDPYARDPYSRDSYYGRESYGRSDAYAREPRPRYDPYAEYRTPPSEYSSSYDMPQAKRYGDSQAPPPRSAPGRY